MLMHYALSVYFALVLKQHLGYHPRSSAMRRIEICYLGPEVETKIVPVFFELGCLLADYDLDVHLIGPDVPDGMPTIARTHPTIARCSDEACSCWRAESIDWVPLTVDGLYERSTVSFNDQASIETAVSPRAETRLHFHRCFYHDCLIDHRPDLVFCPNAGIEVYDSWRPSLERIMQEGTFSVITDYTEEAVYRSDRFCRSMGVSPSLTFVNPFRCPVSSDRAGINVPCFSNGFGCVLNGCKPSNNRSSAK